MEGSSGGLIKVVSPHFPGETEEKQIPGVPAKIRTKNIPNTSVMRTKFHSIFIGSVIKKRALKEFTLYIKLNTSECTRIIVQLQLYHANKVYNIYIKTNKSA